MGNWIAERLRLMYWAATLQFTRVADYLEHGSAEALIALRDSTILVVLFPALLIASGIALGAQSDGLKTAVIAIGLFPAVWMLLVCSWRNGLVLVSIGTVIAEYRSRNSLGKLPETIVSGAQISGKSVLNFLWTEVAIGLIAIEAPLHEMPLVTVMVVIAAIGLTAHSISREGKSYWPSIAKAVIVLTIVGGIGQNFYAHYYPTPQWVNDGTSTALAARRMARYPADYLPPGGTIWLRAGDKTRRCFSAAGVVLLSGGRVRIISDDRITMDMDGVIPLGKTDRGWEYLVDVNGYKDGHKGGRLRIQDTYPFCLDFEAEGMLQLAAKT